MVGYDNHNTVLKKKNSTSTFHIGPSPGSTKLLKGNIIFHSRTQRYKMDVFLKFPVETCFRNDV